MKNLLILICLLIAEGQVLAQKNLTYQSHKYYAAGLNDVWGYTDTMGLEYAIVGTRDGVSIALITTGSGIPIELFSLPGPFSTWRDIKTWNKHAYVTNEASGGLFIIDLDSLPNSVDTFSWKGDTIGLQRAHNIFIDEKGFAYLFGSNISNQGALILDLNNNPKNPLYAGLYDAAYVHDGFVRNDTLWAAEIYAGTLTAVDVSNKTLPVILGSIPTPNLFAHNCWLSDDGKYAFTTDEKADAFIASFDVSDVADMKLLSTNQSHPGSLSIPHNTYYINGYLVTSYYRNGVTIVDANRPENLVETGYYDTSPFAPGDGYEGCWGVYPYFATGTIIASDRQEGLFVLQPNYKRACYIEGNVTESNGGTTVPNAKVEIIGQNISVKSNFQGDYKTGVADSGLYDLRITHPDCLTKIYAGILVDNGIISQINVQLDCLSLSVSTQNEKPGINLSSGGQGYIEYKLNSEYLLPAELKIFDLSGKLSASYKIEQTSGAIYFPALKRGLYIARIVSEKDVATLKFFQP